TRIFEFRQGDREEFAHLAALCRVFEAEFQHPSGSAFDRQEHRQPTSRDRASALAACGGVHRLHSQKRKTRSAGFVPHRPGWAVAYHQGTLATRVPDRWLGVEEVPDLHGCLDLPSYTERTEDERTKDDHCCRLWDCLDNK